MDPLVLVVDDEPHVLRLLVRVLERAAFRVLSASDGDSAIDVLVSRGREIAVVILDVFIPPQGAGVVLDALTAHALDVGLVVVSGDALRSDLDERVQSYGGRFLRKPFLPDDLVATVRELAARAAPT